MIKSTMHTHSTFCDGSNTLEEMVIEAINRNFDVLGFSGHAYCKWDFCGIKEDDKYRAEAKRLKAIHQDRIHLVLGIEEDVSERICNPEEYEYIIGSVHMLPYQNRLIPLDSSKELFDKILSESFDNDFLKLAEYYFNEVKKIRDYNEVDIIGHIDLITKYNEIGHYIDATDSNYLKLVYQCIDELGTEKIYEVNTGAIARGYRTTPYPSKEILNYLYKKDAKLMLNSDCHDKNYLDCYYEESIQLIKDAGFTKLYTYIDGQFKAYEI